MVLATVPRISRIKQRPILSNLSFFAFICIFLLIHASASLPVVVAVFSLKTANTASKDRRIAFKHKEISRLASAKLKVLKVAVTKASASQGICHI